MATVAPAKNAGSDQPAWGPDEIITSTNKLIPHDVESGPQKARSFLPESNVDSVLGEAMNLLNDINISRSVLVKFWNMAYLFSSSGQLYGGFFYSFYEDALEAYYREYIWVSGLCDALDSKTVSSLRRPLSSPSSRPYMFKKIKDVHKSLCEKSRILVTSWNNSLYYSGLCI